MIDLSYRIKDQRAGSDDSSIGKIIAVMAPILMAALALIEWGLR